MAITPGWMRSELMLDHFGVTEETWREAFDPPPGKPATAPPDFALSETTRYVGRAVVAMASDPDRARWNQQSVTTGALAKVYGFTDVDGSQPDVWRYIEEVQETGRDADMSEYR